MEIVLSKQIPKSHPLDYQEIFNKSSDAIYIHEIETGRVIEVNQQASELTGYSKKELLGIEPQEFITDNPQFSLKHAFDYLKKAAKGEPQTFEWIGKRKDGSHCWFEVNLKKVTISGTERILAFFHEIENRKKAEEKLAANEKRLRSTWDTMLEGAQIIGFDWRYLYVNDALTKQAGVLREELIGFTMMEKYPAIEQTEMFFTLQHCMTARVSCYIENQFSFPNGTAGYFQLSVQPVPEGIFILSIDITDRKKSEQKLNKANRLYAVISQINQNIVYVQDESKLFFNSCRIAIEFGKFKIAWISKYDSLEKKNTILEQSGIDIDFLEAINAWTNENDSPQNQVLRAGKYCIVNTTAKEIIPGIVKEFLNANKIQSFMSLPIRKAGTTIGTFNLCAQEFDFFDKEEIALLVEVVGDISFALDVFEKDRVRKSAEEAKIKSDSNLRTIFENTSSGFLLLDNNFNIISYNRQINHFALNAFGFEMKLNTNFVEMVIPQRKEPFRKILESILRGESYQQEVNYPSKDGSLLWYHSTSNRVLDDSGKVIGICLTVDNITGRKTAESRLEQQNKELIKTNEELDRFVYSVSHDLRSPLTSILGLVNFIDEESKEPDTLEHAKMIRTRIQGLDRFIKNILSYSRNNRIDIVSERVNLNNIAAEIMENFRLAKSAGRINFKTEIEENAPFFSDKIRVTTIIENLISNAIKYQDQRKKEQFVIIKGRTEEDNITFSIEDNGIGIAEDQISKIFDMFYRISGKISGSGLGLYIVKEIVAKLDGSITCKSVFGKGTTFNISLKNFKL